MGSIIQSVMDEVISDVSDVSIDIMPGKNDKSEEEKTR